MKQFVAITLSAIAVGLAADAANAQPDIATDHELLAAYCLGAANAVARQPTRVAQYAHDEDRLIDACARARRAL
jgi:hypothetical protein